MGLFSFIKNAGKKLGLGGDDETPPDAASVEKELASHDLGTKDVKIDVVDDKVVLKGVVKDQSTFEKAIVAVGNTLGISKVEASELKVADGADEPVEAKAPVFYTVKKGDNLWKIAEAHYGKGKGARHTAIFEANKPMLTHPDKIYPGQVLRIPDLDAG